MGKQCPGCNKLAGLETDEDPDVEISLDGTTVSANMRLVRRSTCCSEDMKEASFEPEEEIDPAEFEGHVDEDGEALDGHELDVEEHGIEVTERSEGKGRGLKTFYGVKVDYEIHCSCQKPGDKALYTGSLSDECQASHMDELT